VLFFGYPYQSVHDLAGGDGCIEFYIFARCQIRNDWASQYAGFSNDWQDGDVARVIERNTTANDAAITSGMLIGTG
jgi:hypothetical protein